MSATLPFVALVLWLIAGGINSVITTAEMEKKGNAFLQPLDHLLDAIPRRFVAVQVHASDIQAIDTDIDQAFVDLDRVADLYGADLQFTPEGLEARQSGQLRISPLRDRWRVLTSANPDGNGYDHMMTDLRSIMKYAGDTSSLALDPDLDTAYLIDVILRALPEMQARLGVILRQTHEWPNSSISLTAPALERAVQQAEVKEEGLARIDRDLEILLAEDARFYGVYLPLHLRLPEEWKHVVQATEAFTTLVKTAEPISGRGVISAGNGAQSACRQFWTTAHEQLDQLLTIRIRAQQAKRARALLVGGAMVVLAGFAGWRWGNKLELEFREKMRFLQTAEEGVTASGISRSSRSPLPIDRVPAETGAPHGKR